MGYLTLTMASIDRPIPITVEVILSGLDCLMKSLTSRLAKATFMVGKKPVRKHPDELPKWLGLEGLEDTCIGALSGNHTFNHLRGFGTRL